jgi:DNA-binding beta-propeller fold protein YncE
MKKIVPTLFLSILSVLGSLSASAQHSLEKVWQTDSVFQFSEGVVLDPGKNLLYVSNTIGSPMERDGKGSVSTVGLDGKIINLNFVEGMNAPKDIQLYKDHLYAADLDEVVVIDVNKPGITQRIKIDGARLLHNIAIDAKGIVYVSDMFAGRVYRIENGTPSVYLDNLGYAAGLLSAGSDLYVLKGGSLIKADANKQVTTIAKGLDNQLNGITMVKPNEFIVTSWGGRMYYINADGTNQVLLDTRSKQIACGIVYYDPKKNIVYMTSDQDNVLYAFNIK